MPWARPQPPIRPTAPLEADQGQPATEPPQWHRAPSPSMLHAQYWCYVTSARRDMAPKEFQEFLDSLGPLRSPYISRAAP